MNDPRLKQLADGMRAWLKALDPALADYDVAIYLYSWQPRLRLARGRRLAELKRFKEAETDLTLAVRRQADDPEAWKERGRLYFQMGKTDKAVADFRKAVDLLGDRALSSVPAASEVDRLFANIADEVHLQKLTSALQGNPEDVERRRERGEWYARHRRWHEAAVDFKLALEREPPVKALQWLHAAPALAAAGDREGYRWICRELRKRFGDEKDHRDQVAKVYLLFPDAGNDIEWAGQLEDGEVTAAKNSPWAPYILFGKSLADYRRGRLDAAAAGLEALLRRIESGKEPDVVSLRIISRPDLAAICHLTLALTLHKKGETKTAQEHFQRGSKLVNQYAVEPFLFPLDNTQYSHDWLIAWLLHREAQTVMEGNKAEQKNAR